MNIPSILAGIGPLGTPELVIIGVLILILFGAKKLPMFARSLGKSMGEFKKARDEFEAELHRAQDEVSNPPLEDKPKRTVEPVGAGSGERDKA